MSASAPGSGPSAYGPGAGAHIPDTQQTVYTHGPFGERLNPLKDLNPADIFGGMADGSFASASGDKGSRSTRTMGLGAPQRLAMHHPAPPGQPGFFASGMSMTTATSSAAASSSKRQATLAAVRGGPIAPSAPATGISSSIEPFLAKQVRAAVAARSASTQLHLPLLREYADMSQVSSASSAAPAESSAAPEAPVAADSGVVATVGSTQVTLQTGEDAIKFFVQHGAGNPLKFVYCNRTDAQPAPKQISIPGMPEDPERTTATTQILGSNMTREQARAAAIAKLAAVSSTASFRPYDLTIVSRKQANPEYFTVSSTGVVHVLPDSPTEFLPLTDWMHQASSFNVLRSSRFFQHFLSAKTFRLWRANVRYRLFCKQRQMLQRNLFLARPSFCSSLLQVNKIVYEMQQVPLLRHRQAIFSDAEYNEQQLQERTQAAKTLEQKVALLEAEVERVCKGARDRAKQYDHGITSDDLATSKFAQYLLKDGSRDKSMVAIKRERADRIRKLKHAALEADMLGEFVRLVDYIQVEGLVHSAITAVARLLGVLHEPGRAKRPMFQTSVAFGDSALVFSPTMNDFAKLLRDVAEGAVHTVATADRVLLLPRLKPFVSSLVTDYPQVGQMVAADPIFAACLQAIESKVQVDFRAVSDNVQVLERYRPVFEFGKAWVQSPYCYRGPQGQLAEVQPDALEADMKQQVDWAATIGNIKNSYEGGVFQAETKNLKGRLLPIAEGALVGMKEYLLLRFRVKSSELKDMLRERIRLLKEDPPELALFAKHVHTYNTLCGEARDLLMRARQVEFMFHLLERHGVDVTIDSVQYEEGQAIVQEFSAQLGQAEQRIEERMGLMKGQVYQRIAKLTGELSSQRLRLMEGEFVNDKAKPDDVLQDLSVVDEAITGIEAEIKRTEDFQVLFKMDPYRFDDHLKDCRRAYELKERFWTLYRDWLRKTAEWNKIDFLSLNVDKMGVDVRDMYTASHELTRQIRDKQGREVAVTVRLKRMIQEYKVIMPLVLELGNPAMRPQHWRSLFTQMGQTWTSEKDITLKKLRALNIFSYKTLINEVCESAVGEYSLEQGLAKIEAAWAKTNFVLVPYQKQKDDLVWILGDVEEVSVLLEEHQMILQSMLGSQYIKAVQVQVEDWERKLATLADVLEEWLTCQRGWMYMEPIFSAVDIQRQLPTEAKIFSEVDRFWRELMRRCSKSPNVIAAATANNILPLLIKNNADLDKIQKQLEEYLETKRAAFPRFYFLANEELLQILAQAREPQAVQPHLNKCFENIQRLTFTNAPNSVEVTGMVSSENEEVSFPQHIFTVGSTEAWLNDVEATMRRTVRLNIKRALVSYPTSRQGAIERGSWLRAFPSQAILTADQIMWTQNVTAALAQMEKGANPGALADFFEFSKAQIAAMVSLIRGDLTALERQMMSNLIIVDVHARDVVENLLKAKCSKLGAFDWIKQLRYYWLSDKERWVANGSPAPYASGAAGALASAGAAAVAAGASSARGNRGSVFKTGPTKVAISTDEGEVMDWEQCVVRQTTGEFAYRYEYLGNATRLVITALTDRCYLTLTGALAMHNGGSPQGPAGTGKTETVKDLGKAMANQVVVFNCSEGLEIVTMSRFFSGLAQAGAWACFDEFNRIDIEVLSVIAQQILTIQTAIIQHRNPFEFQGRLIPLDSSFGVFITMNPGYAGRSELPDNLKALFRPVAMMVPDYAMIAQIILFSEGFENAPALSKKMVQLYKLASEQLSQQDHYDFGMRAVKSVLVMAGALKRRSDDVPEDVVLIRAMRDSNIPKFLAQDIPLFQGIISDLFPGVAVPETPMTHLQRAVHDALVDAGLQPLPSLVTKIIQLHETVVVRTGVMVVGSAFTGKTTCSKVLSKALGRLFKSNPAVAAADPFVREVESYTLNPKSVTMGELYGQVNPVSNEWTDGLVSDLVRTLAAETHTPSRKWVLFDGPVDALWIENMNTVLDDNKMLCLVNSERIRLSSQMTMMFEVEDLSQASPATVSRCGMVYLEPVYLAWTAIVNSWAASFAAAHPLLPASIVEFIASTVTKNAAALLAFVREQCVERVATNDNQLIRSCLHLFEALGAEILKPYAKLKLAGSASAQLAGAVGADDAADGDDSDHEGAEGGAVAEVGASPENTDAALAVEASTADETGSPGGLGGMTPMPNLKEEPSTPMMDPKVTQRLLGLVLYLAFTWSIGANIEDAHRAKFSTFLRKTVAEKLAPAVPISQQSYELTLDIAKQELVPWASVVPAFTYDKEAPFFSVLVPTPETVCTETLIKALIASRRFVMLSGETGTGKTVAAQNFLRHNDDKYASIAMQFSARTAPRSLTDAMEFKLEKRGRRSILGAPRGKVAAAVYCDDMNMPAPERYGAQPPLELLRQTIDQGGYYDLSKKKPFFKQIRDVVFLGTMAPPGGGRTKCSQRLTRHFSMFWLTNLSNSSLHRIFSSILDGFFHSVAGHLQTDLSKVASSVISASVDLYSACRRSLLPTPSKSHYTFNLRDLSKVVQGMCQVRSQNITDVVDLLRLWIHESARVFRDRLVDDGDRRWFDSQCRTRLKEVFDLDWPADAFADVLFGDFAAPSLEPPPQDPNAPPGAEVIVSGDRNYEELRDLSSLQQQLADHLAEYNLIFSSQMHLVFFKDAIHHLARVSRVLRQPRGNALLVGVGGSGRQSLTKLAAFIADYKCVSIEISSGYSIQDWRDALKQLLETAGAENQPVVFLLSDAQIVHDAFLEDINNLLNTGQVPNLFANDELDAIVLKVRQQAKKAGRGEAREAVLEQFNHNVRENLHVVLAFSPIGDTFRDRLRMFPSLVNCCAIDWYSPWPRDALLAVAQEYLHTQSAGNGSDAGPAAAAAYQHAQMLAVGGAATGENASASDMIAMHKTKLAKVAVEMHMSVKDISSHYYEELRRNNYVTPSSFLQLLHSYATMLGEQQDALSTKAMRYRNGLSKLNSTNQLVAQLRQDLINLQPILQRSSEETAELLVHLEREQQEANSTRLVCQQEAEETEAQTRAVAVIADDCQADLDEAMPAMNAALKALSVLQRDHINIVKSLPHPPQLVRTVMEAVCLLFGLPTDWDSAKRLLGKSNFIDMCRQYKKDEISPKTLKKLQKYIQDKDFRPEKMESVAEAAVSLCKWVRAIDVYARVYKAVEPKRQALETARSALDEAQAKLHGKQTELRVVEARVAGLQQRFKAKQAERDEIDASMTRTKIQLARAEQLVAGLGSEGSRWEQQAQILASDMQNLVGDMLVSAGFVAYLGPFTAEYRSRLVTQWVRLCLQHGIPVADGPMGSSTGFSLARALGDPLMTRQWNIQGLPADQYSIENGILAVRGTGGGLGGAVRTTQTQAQARNLRWPLMIDPQDQANRWIKNMARRDNLQVIQTTTAATGGGNWKSVLENAIRFGQPVLLENVSEKIEPSIEPVLAKQLFRKGGQWLIRLGDQDVPYSQHFKLFITTKLPNPHYVPDIFVKVSVINFAVTPKGLEDQLLATVCSLERADLEHQVDTLLVQISEDKKELSDIENRILHLLHETAGNILDDEELLQTLSASRSTAAAIGSRMEQSEKTVASIETVREGYRPVATHGSLLFFAMSDLALADGMYQNSLLYFTQLYTHVIKSCVKTDADSLPMRVRTLIADLTSFVYTSVVRGIFVKDRLFFALLIAVHVSRQAGEIDSLEFDFFVRGQVPSSASAIAHALPEDSPALWLEQRVWRMLRTGAGATSLTYLGDIAREIVSEAGAGSGGAWMRWITSLDSAESEAAPSAASALALPNEWAQRLTPFQRLVVVRVLRPEKLLSAARGFVSQRLGSSFVSATPFDLQAVFAQSAPVTPIVFILSPGADPLPYIISLAEQRGIDTSSRVKVLSMGKGQGEIAQELIDIARREGQWVVLQNCHLAASWMSSLEQAIEKTRQETDIHDSFRLWLTTMPTKSFSVAVLHNSLKVTTEAPRGVNNNIAQTFVDMSEERYAASAVPPRQLGAYRTLLFSLAAFHAVLLERRKFGPLGFNIAYEWMASDLTSSQRQLAAWLTESASTASGADATSTTPIVPWEMLTAIFGEINYGGRVTDDKDIRCVAALLSTFMAPPQITAIAGRYPLVPSGALATPPPAVLESLPALRSYCASLPDDTPDLFGLHANAAISLQLNDSSALLSRLLSVQSGGALGDDSVEGGTSGSSNGGSVTSTASDPMVLALAADIQQRLPKNIDKSKAAASTFAGVSGFPRLNEAESSDVETAVAALGNPLGVFLSQEVDRMNRLLDTMRASLAALQSSIKGLEVMSSSLEGVYAALLFNRVPAAWARVAYPSLKPLAAWVDDLLQRVRSYETWLVAGVPVSFWPSGYFFPQGFLTASLQTFARANRVPIDELGFTATVLPYTSAEDYAGALGSGEAAKDDSAGPRGDPRLGVVVHGLYLQGARWDDHSGAACLEESLPRQLFAEVPLVWLQPTLIGARGLPKTDSQGRAMYDCPVYKTVTRAGQLSTTGHSTNFVVSLALPSKQGLSVDHWVRRGTAIVMQLVD